MGAREEIMLRIRDQIKETSLQERRDLVAKRLNEHKAGTIPDADGRNLVETFMQKAEAAAASVVKVKPEGIATAIGDFLRQHNLPQELRMGDDPRLGAIKWGANKPEIRNGPSDGLDLVGLSHASTAASESGTLLLQSGAKNPTTLNFLPENHIVLVRKSDIMWSYEDCWTKLRTEWECDTNGVIPRTINMVTGPSRSADIEQTLILGAHGPVRLHIIVVEG